MSQETDVGPLISAAAAAKVESQVKRAVAEGARLRCGGAPYRPGGLAGHFFEPTLLTDVRHGSLPTQEEIFGPVLSITVVSDADEAIRLANDSEFGLGASIYTNNLAVAMRAMESIKAGTFWINDPLTDNDAGPFGGMRHSGIGRARRRRPRRLSRTEARSPRLRDGAQVVLVSLPQPSDPNRLKSELDVLAVDHAAEL
jgi:acyl-CoA reductase-like NAD-dependent aldehyde dehydrogenase